eukprot:361266-Chlamydomonas_euryale.AAC.3
MSYSTHLAANDRPTRFVCQAYPQNCAAVRGEPSAPKTNETADRAAAAGRSPSHYGPSRLDPYFPPLPHGAYARAATSCTAVAHSAEIGRRGRAT